MTEKTLAELRAETDWLMHRPLPLHMEHEARIAALAAERDAADFEIECLTSELDEARDELDGIAEVLDAAGVPQDADGPDGRRWTLSLGARVEYVIAERDEARAEVEWLRAVVQDLCEVLDECVFEIDTRYGGPPGSNNIDRELIERAYAAMAKAKGET